MRRMNGLAEYYARRARQYEDIYRREEPIRQKELTEIGTALREILWGRDVLEVACGTGFWTAVATEGAKSILAIDISDEMLAVAKAKSLANKNIRFCLGDVYSLDFIEGTFDACLANFWLSHVPRSKLHGFLCGFHQKLIHGAVVFMADNLYVPGVGGELAERAGCEDTFKLRRLSDGSEYEVLKNCYEAEQLHRILEPFSCELNIHIGTCYWWLSYQKA